MGRSNAFPSPWLAFAALVGLFLAYASATVEGAAVLVAMGVAAVAVLGSAVWLGARGRTSTPLLERPADLLCVFGFLLFAVIAVFVDAVQAGAGPGPITDSYAPQLMKHAFESWVKQTDPLLGFNPLWYWFLAMLSPLLYLPFYIAASIAFMRENNAAWVRNLSLMWGAMLSFTTALIITEELWGSHASPNRAVMLGGYGPYVVFPLIVIWRVWRDPIFHKSK